jgi:multidrug transporter EmrE-like cation transporter
MTLTNLFLIVGAVAVASVGNSLSAAWAGHGYKLSWSFYGMILISPLVFMTFGMVAGRVGLAVAAGTVDALLVATTVLIGLVFFREWSKVSILQYLGIALSVSGICLMLFFPRTGA